MNASLDQTAIEEHFDIILYQATKLYDKASTHEIEDLIQVGFLGVLKAVRNFDSNKGNMKAYAFSCVKNHLIRYLRKERFWRSHVKLGFSDFYDDYNSDDTTSSIKQVIKGLQKGLLPLEKKIISLKCDGYTRKEICSTLNLYNKDYYSLFFSAIGKMRKNES